MPFATMAIIIFLLSMMLMGLLSLKLDKTKERKQKGDDKYDNQKRMETLEVRLSKMIERGDRGIKKESDEEKSDIDKLNDSIK